MSLAEKVQQVNDEIVRESQLPAAKRDLDRMLAPIRVTRDSSLLKVQERLFDSGLSDVLFEMADLIGEDAGVSSIDLFGADRSGFFIGISWDHEHHLTRRRDRRIGVFLDYGSNDILVEAMTTDFDMSRKVEYLSVDDDAAIRNKMDADDVRRENNWIFKRDNTGFLWSHTLRGEEWKDKDMLETTLATAIVKAKAGEFRK